ncbi:hypothetical protein [Tellurirhabdus bombi]|uniref:hypothetical protein n=1 Tax=Tellurirhabdus bombi TaxID=2907205 RepID=UPI001F3CB12B|nr:hypothetical protein [Tellurirhabdus bombi]
MLSISRLDYMRMAAGICIVVDGNPLIFFFKETLKLAPGSSVFTAAFLALGLILMVPFTLLRKLYKPNYLALMLSLGFLFLTLLYYFFFMSYAYTREATDLIYVAYSLIFIFLLINVPNEVLKDIVPIFILFAIVSNFALIYSLIRDPFWHIGQRASISYSTDDDHSGNPHPFAKNALIGLIASLVWASRPKTPAYIRTLCLVSAVFNLGVQLLTLVRSSFVALALMVFIFCIFNVRMPQIRSALRMLRRPASLFVMAIALGVIVFFIRRNMTIYHILSGYVDTFITKNIDNVYALLGMKVNNQVATFDASSVQRTISLDFFKAVYQGHLHWLILGQGYKFIYLDIPVLEALVNHGILGFVLFAGLNVLLLILAIRSIRLNLHPFSTFLGYFYFYLFVVIFTNGRPYDYTFWFPYLLMSRFMGVENLLPARLLSPNV